MFRVAIDASRERAIASNLTIGLAYRSTSCVSLSKNFGVNIRCITIKNKDASSEQRSKHVGSSLRESAPSPSIRQECYTSQDFRFGDSCHEQAAGRLGAKPSPNCLLWTVPHEFRDNISVKNNHGWYLVKTRRFPHGFPRGYLKFHPAELFEKLVDRRSKIL